MKLFRPPNRFRWLVISAIFLSCIGLASAQPLLKNETSPEKNLKVFDAMWNTVNRKYYDVNFNGVDWGAVRERYRPLAEKAESRESLLRVLRTAIGEMKSSHLSVKLAVTRRHFEQQVGQKFNRNQDTLVLTLGFEITAINGQYVITEVTEDSSAQAAGIQPGWVLTHLNGKALSANDFEWGGEFSEGKQVALRFLDNQHQEKSVTLTYQWLVEKTERASRLLEGNVALIRFSSFAGGIDKWLAQELNQYRNAQGVILDLRSNPGGYMSVLSECLTPFFDREIVFGEFIERGDKDYRLRVKGTKKKAYTLPVVVLVDQRSSSCSEIFAAAMQETGRGKVIGRKTAGAVLASVSERLPEDFWLDIAIWDYKTARRRRLEGVGLEPDLTVPLTLENIRQQRDADLERALEILKTKGTQ
ncbi:MAG: hypothetical protein JST84_10130 [Acidobacteria bacterium]|nr:hypothetical protein [Acidobacteriota bacterium]